jgi:succinate dehydrogenase / fumarate reductase, membrane anchor subunit
MSGNGTGHFKQQRLTAMANVPLVLFVLWFIVGHLGASRADIVASIQNKFVAIVLIVAVFNMLKHMHLGMQMIIEDYVHDARAVRTSMILNVLFVTLLGVVSLCSILKMSFGF